MSAKNSDIFSMLAKPIRSAILMRGFSTATEPQAKAIPFILKKKDVLLVAPTGTGKTEASFLPILSFLITMPEKRLGIKVLYITPLRALNRDLLERLEWWCKKLDLRLAVRHGDTEVRERGRQALVPPDILITTPETLQAILPGWVMRRHLMEVRWVIIDEVHELAGEKRGSQLSLALQRLRYITERDYQIIGLSATIGTPERVAKFLVGDGKPCEVVKVPVSRFIQIGIVFPKPMRQDYNLAERLFTYPEVAARLRIIRESIKRYQSTLLFTNTRTEAEILASRFRVWDIEFPLGVHHGSLSKPTRVTAERDLKDGKLSGIICTSSLELGIDIGILEFVIQYNSPRQVTRLLQRVGRSGHRIGGIARGTIITRDSDDTLESIVIARKVLAEELEPVGIPIKPYDALTHQLIGLLLHRSKWSFDEALEVLKGAYPYRDLSEEELKRVLSYMDERHPRLVWVSFTDKIFAKPRNVKPFYKYYFENLSMIPEEKQFLVLNEEKKPIGVLDEVFIAEHGEIGAKFVVGGRVWKIIQIYRDKVYVKPEEDYTGAIPSWIGEEIPVPYDVAIEVGTIRRFVEGKLGQGTSFRDVVEELSKGYPVIKQTIAQALVEVRDQFIKKLLVPTDRRVTIERWGEYIIIQCCFGHLVNRTISRILGHLLSEKYGFAVGVQQDPYRIILKVKEVTLQEVKELLIDLSHRKLYDLTIQSITKTGMFKRRFLHVAKKFGAISKDADLSSISVSGLIESFKNTVIYEEAVRTTIQMDTDIERTMDILNRIATRQVELTLIEDHRELTPTAKIGIEELSWKSDIIPSHRMKHLIIQSARARLINEVRTIACTDCWSYVESLKIKNLVKCKNCPQCGSMKIGLLNESEDKVIQLCNKVHTSKDGVPRRFRRLYETLMGSVALILKYQFPSAVVLAGRGLYISDALEILKTESNFTDRLIELILDAERKVMMRRFLP